MRLDITKRTDLAARVLLTLDEAGSRLKGPELARRVGTTSGYVTQVVAPLSERGWVASVPGPTGGYELVGSLLSISVLDVVEAVEGPTDDGRCVLRHGRCGAAEPCVLHDTWTKARTDLIDALASIPLSRATTHAGPVPLASLRKEGR